MRPFAVNVPEYEWDNGGANYPYIHNLLFFSVNSIAKSIARLLCSLLKKNQIIPLTDDIHAILYPNDT
jgi:hypothetical protein